MAARRAPSARGRIQLRYIPALDGLRAFAVVAVLLYHDNENGWFQGGFFGVDVFFVVSGYLITSLLFAEWRNTTTISLKEFYLRRGRRLLPALYALLIATAFYSIIFAPETVTTVRGDTVAALFYVTNWWLIFQNVSYAEAAVQGSIPLLQHLWSLAIEEQFYIVWPLLFGLGMRIFQKKRVQLVAVIVLAGILSALAMGHFYDPHDPSAVYFNTFTHAFGLLFGAALGLMWSPWRLTAKAHASARIVFDVAAVGSSLVLLWCMHNYGFFDDATWPRGFVVVCVASVVLIGAVAHPTSLVAKYVFSQRICTWIGERSYGIYLWHILVFTIVDESFLGIPAVFLRLLITFAIADVSYRYLETPLRRGLIGRNLKRMRTSNGLVRARIAGGFTAAAVFLGVIVLAIVVAFATATPPTLAGEGGDSSTTQFVTTATSAVTNPDGTPVDTVPTTPLPPSANPPFAVGDSVLEGAARAVERAIPGIVVDAHQSRQYGEMIEIVRARNAAGQLGDIVVVHGGTNGRVTDGDFAAMMDQLKKVKYVVVVNQKVPRGWQDPNNAVFQNGIGNYPNAALVDWLAISKDHPEYFVKDGFHLTDVGQEAYAGAIRAKLFELFAKESNATSTTTAKPAKKQKAAA